MSGRHKVFSHRAGAECCSVDVGNVNPLCCAAVRQTKSRAGPSATVGHTKHLVTDPSGCMTTLHWAACVWESWRDAASVFTADLVHTSGIPARSCPH